MAAKAGLAYVAIIPRDYLITLPSGTAIRADEAVKDAVFERRSCENGSKGPRYSDRAMTATSPADDHPASTPAGDSDVSDTDLQIPLGDAPVPARGGQPRPPAITPIKLSIAETTRLTRLAAAHAAGLISRARLAFALRWSLRRRLHQATAAGTTTAPGYSTGRGNQCRPEGGDRM